MAQTATSATPVGVTKHLASLPPQPEALMFDADMQARVEQDSARIMAAINDPTTVFEVLTAAHGIQVVELEGPFDGLYGHYLRSTRTAPVSSLSQPDRLPPPACGPHAPSSPARA